MDRIDLPHLHRDDSAVPMEARLEVPFDLRERGPIRRIGLSNHAVWRVMQARAILGRMGSTGDALQRMLPCTHSPLGSGLLTGRYSAGGSGRMTQDARYAPTDAARTADQLAPSLAALNFPMGPGLYAAIAALYPAPPPATDRTEETP